MLGRVFEGVMEPEARHGSGTFYTPVHLVSQLVDATLEAYLSSRLGCSLEAAAEHVGTPDANVRRLVAEVTVLDPAVGSGRPRSSAARRIGWTSMIRVRWSRPGRTVSQESHAAFEQT